MATRKQFLTEPYGGYHAEPTPSETADLTHVEKGSRAGELLRRYWQPVCLSEEVEKLPKRERMFGEDIVVFRTTDDEVAILDIHCPHRGTSLEFGMC
ncbi:MAG: Rieske 2Fe-2S domain-containing protein, partial [Rhodospirillales bacterium]